MDLSREVTSGREQLRVGSGQGVETNIKSFETGLDMNPEIELSGRNILLKLILESDAS